MNVKYTDNNGNEVELTTEIVKKYMVSGCAEKVTDQEIATFIKTCEYGQLNPWLSDPVRVWEQAGTDRVCKGRVLKTRGSASRV